MRPRLAIVLLPWGLAVLPAHPQDTAATLGKQRAAASPLEWEARETRHPTLGDIRFAFLKIPVITAVGNARVFSRPYVSCQKVSRRFVIELTNGASPDDSNGLKPSVMPKLVCNRLGGPGEQKLVPESLWANWEVSDIGDAQARGFRAFPLRECVSITVLQEVVLPPGSAQKTARVEFEILPYDRELDSVFVTCGETSAYAPAAPPARVAAAASPKLVPAPAAPTPIIAPAPPVTPAPPATPSAPAPAPDMAWLTARTLSSGKTNVRTAPTLKSEVIAQLFPGAVVLVQRTSGEWWRAKGTGGANFDGFIREDRLVFK
jgi:hypothetical protein